MFYFTAFVDINIVCINLVRKKIEQVCERHYFRWHIHIVHKISGLEIRKKVVVAVHCRTGYKFEYYQEEKKKARFWQAN